MLFNVYCLVSLMLRMRESDEDSTEHGEDISLDEGYQELKTVHEEHHHETEHRQS